MGSMIGKLKGGKMHNLWSPLGNHYIKSTSQIDSRAGDGGQVVTCHESGYQPGNLHTLLSLCVCVIHQPSGDLTADVWLPAQDLWGQCSHHRGQPSATNRQSWALGGLKEDPC